jgi:hypothetical protein
MRPIPTVISPEPVPVWQHTPDAVKRGVPTPEGEDPFNLIRLPQMIEDLIHCGRVQARFVIEKMIIAIFVTVLVEPDYCENVLHIICAGHMPRIPNLRGEGTAWAIRLYELPRSRRRLDPWPSAAASVGSEGSPRDSRRSQPHPWGRRV